MITARIGFPKSSYISALMFTERDQSTLALTIELKFQSRLRVLDTGGLHSIFPERLKCCVDPLKPPPIAGVTISCGE